MNEFWSSGKQPPSIFSPGGRLQEFILISDQL